MVTYVIYVKCFCAILLPMLLSKDTNFLKSLVEYNTRLHCLVGSIHVEPPLAVFGSWISEGLYRGEEKVKEIEEKILK